MKKILISIFCGTILVFGYFLFLAVLYQIYPISFDTLAILLIPLNLPYSIYQKVFGFYYGNPMVVKILNFAGAIILYSIPFYLILAWFEKIKKNKTQFSDKPPEPPFF